MIEIRRTGDGDPLKFEVVVREGSGESHHEVTITQETCMRLTAGKHTPEQCLDAAFRFLLDREPKEFDPPAVRRERNLAVFPRIRARAAALSLAALNYMPTRT